MAAASPASLLPRLPPMRWGTTTWARSCARCSQTSGVNSRLLSAFEQASKPMRQGGKLAMSSRSLTLRHFRAHQCGVHLTVYAAYTAKTFLASLDFHR